ncbi:hypothetical protein EDB85DRAFT_1886641 [Lactarius pseudohatsudake]|nr:hypothetical protein EDB85DRAFT_1886641 [Lactarius pseudohatsudake]
MLACRDHHSAALLAQEVVGAHPPACVSAAHAVTTGHDAAGAVKGFPHVGIAEAGRGPVLVPAMTRHHSVVAAVGQDGAGGFLHEHEIDTVVTGEWRSYAQGTAAMISAILLPSMR